MDENATAVKVEVNTLGVNPFRYFNIGKSNMSLLLGLAKMIYHPFADIRAAVDKMADGERPVPRIERRSVDESEGYDIWCDADFGGLKYLSPRMYHDLSEIVGHPLPVYTERHGEWERLAEGGTSYHSTVAMFNYSELTGFEVWRFRMFEGE